MTKEEFLKAVSEKIKTDIDVSRFVVNAVIETITESLAAGEEVKFIGFGSFVVATKQARIGRNPKTGEVLHLPEKKFPKFTPGALLKAAIENGEHSGRQ